MDKLPDNMEKDDSIMAQQNKPEAPKKACRKHLWAWIACGIALLAALGATLSAAAFPSEASKGNVDLAIERPGFTPSPAVSPSGADEENGDPENADIRPLLYKDGGNIYLAAGAESIKLDSTSSEGSYFFRGEVSANENTLYYLTNFNASSYESDMMRIKLGVKDATPERIAENVLYVRVSPDEKKILFMSGGAYGPYGLYMCPPGGEPVVIAENVSDFDFGFSADGSYAYYYTYDTERTSLFLNLYSGNGTKEIFESKNDGKNVYQVYIDESGYVLIVTGFFGFVEHQDYTAYLYEGGETRCVAEHASYVRSLGQADEFVYVTPDNELVVYERGDKQVISDKGSGLDIDNDMWRKAAGKRIVFTEGKDMDARVLYEFTLQDGKVMIGNTGWNYYPNADFSRIAYGKEDGMYMASKSGGKWSETKVSEYGGWPAFDFNDNYLYYCSTADGFLKNNTLYRISLGTGKTEKLFAGVERFLPRDGGCYLVSVEGDIYCVKNENESVLIMKDVSEKDSTGWHPTGFHVTKDGIYVYNYKNTSVFSDVYYISGGKCERVCGGDVKRLECAGLMPIRFYD